MHILSLLNTSNRQSLETDSGLIFQRILASELARIGFRYTLLTPVPVNFDGITCVPFSLGDSKYQVRFTFPWKRISSLISRLNPDVVFVNQAELGGSIRAVLVELGSPARLVTYCHYLPLRGWSESFEEVDWDPSLNDANLAYSILLRIISSITVSDLFLVQSEFARSILDSSCRHLGGGSLGARVRVLPPPADPFLMLDNCELSARRAIIYNHRLYGHYGTDFIYDLLKSLQVDDLSVIVMDPMSRRSAKRNRLDSSVNESRRKLAGLPNLTIRTDGANRQAYKAAIAESRVALAPYRRGCVWSMATIDCMGMGVPVVAPNIAAFPEFIPQELLYETREEERRIIEEILLDDGAWKRSAEMVRASVDSLSPENIARRFLSYLD